MDQKTLFLNTSPTRLFLKAALPGSVGMLASSLYQLLDGIFVGQILGNEAFAALNLVMPFVIINFAISDLIGVGSAVPISVRLGEKRPEEANNIFTIACLLIFGQGIVVGGALFLLAPTLLHLMGAEGALAAMAVQYLRVYAVCSPIVGCVFASDNFLRICGQIRTSMMLNVLMSVLCVVFEFFFLAVLRIGIRGAALGTCLSMMVCAFLAMLPFFRGKMALKFVRPKFSRRILGQIVSCGCPTFLNNIAGRVTSIIMNMVLLQLGGASAVSVYGILMYADGIILQLMYGMCDSLQPAVGYNWGAARRALLLHGGGGDLARRRGGSLRLPAADRRTLHGHRRGRGAGYGRTRAADLQPDLYHPLVQLCNPELCFGDRKAGAGFNPFGFDGLAVPCRADCGALADGAQRIVGQHAGYRAACRHHGRHHPARPAPPRLEQPAQGAGTGGMSRKSKHESIRRRVARMLQSVRATLFIFSCFPSHTYISFTRGGSFLGAAWGAAASRQASGVMPSSRLKTRHR